MKQLVEDTMGPALFQFSWLQRLPEGTRAILANADFSSLDMLVVTADKIHEVHSRLTAAEVKSDAQDILAQLPHSTLHWQTP